jgi:hypothetical protein
VYFQTVNLHVVEQCFDGEGWVQGGGGFENVLPRASMAVTSWGDGVIRIYYTTHGNIITERCWDGYGWNNGGFREGCMPGSKIAVTPAPVLRVYFQQGNMTSAVTEWMYNNGWGVGNSTLPPA